MNIKKALRTEKKGLVIGGGILLTLLLVGAVVAATVIIIDAFTAETQKLRVSHDAPLDASVSGNDSSIIGLERDAVLELMSGTSVSFLDINAGDSGVVAFSAGSGVHMKASIIWDGDDDDPYTLDPTGLGGENLIEAADDGFVIDITDWEGNDLDLTVTIYTDGANYSQATIPLRGDGKLPPPEKFSLSFDDDFTSVGSGADLTNVGAIVLDIETVATGADVSIDLLILDATRDFGDLPERYGMTTKEDNGARHSKNDTYLGEMVDAELDGPESDMAAGDDLLDMQDEDGVKIMGEWQEGSNGGQVHINTTTSSNTDAACVDGWVDWNNDGDFEDEKEHILDSVLVFDLGFMDNKMQAFDIPAGALSFIGKKEVFARFRAAPEHNGENGCDIDMTPFGYVKGGEVEDYRWEFIKEGCEDTDGCVDFTLLNIEYLDDEVVLTWEITNRCEYGLSYAAFSLPEGVTALGYPEEGGTYLSALTGHTYGVENPGMGWYSVTEEGEKDPRAKKPKPPGNNLREIFRAVKFEELGADGIKEGGSEIFVYSLPADSFDPTQPITISIKGGTYTYHVEITPAICAE